MIIDGRFLMTVEKTTVSTSASQYLAKKKFVWAGLIGSRSRVSARVRNTTPLCAAAVLLVVVSAAEVVAAWLDPRLPPAALAMVFMLVLFAVQGGPDTGTAGLYEATSPVLPILFVPAAVGAFQLGGLTVAVWAALALIIGGLTIGLVATIGVLAQQLFQEREQ